MKNDNHLKKDYKNFKQFLATVCAKELEYFILDSEFTSAFNYRIKKIIDEIQKEGKKDIEFSVLFNTSSEVALIDADIIGSFISNTYSKEIEEYYKGILLDKIIKEVINGNEKVQNDFITISYSILYRTINELYKEIKCKKEIIKRYINKYNLQEHKEKTIGINIAILLILEDVCEYISIENKILNDSVHKIISSKKI
ncbi:hypothetical protein OW763_02975 [Clostridium aestuarii]|uniref:Uncharacterized protein n=1 Tax=Clostridium aestuarii TaxID=338193 RepID=A0ABT4CWF0_9CLOT|nr:hypothetical protein [Clostridium aestuarii]MCY6483319.1 hypothetical protein [Clostridium aestuarii]